MTGRKEKMQVDHDDVRRFYDSVYHQSGASPSPLPWHMRRIAKRLGDLRNKSVLDVACGSGQWLAEMRRRGAEISGLDISQRAIEQCRTQLPGAEVHQGVAEELPFPDGKFDLVTCLGSLEHFLDQPKALREIRRVAKPAARFLILVPNAGFLTRRLGFYGGTGQAAIRETVRPLDEWAALLEDAGLSICGRWRDLHPISMPWITMGPIWNWPVRGVQALALACWPLAWQYQVYFYAMSASAKSESEHSAKDDQ